MDVAPALFFGTTRPHTVISFQYKTCKDGSVLGVTVTRIALLTHCQALTQACGYTEGMSGPCCTLPGDPASRPCEMHVEQSRDRVVSTGSRESPMKLVPSSASG